MQEIINVPNSTDVQRDQSQNASRKQQGISIPETLVALAIGVAVAVAAFMLLPRVFATIRANKITDEFQTSIPAVQTAFANQTTFASLTTGMVARNGYMSSSFMDIGAGGTPTGTLKTQWGSIVFAPASAGQQGQVTIDKVPTRECVKIAESWGSEMYLTGSINGTTVKDLANSPNADLDAIGTQCNAAKENTLVFTFGRV